MLARLSSKTSKALGLHVQLDTRSTGIVSISDDEAIVVDVDCLREFFAPLPEHAWRQLLGSVAPMYRTVHNILTEDTERVADFLSKLEIEGDRCALPHPALVESSSPSHGENCSTSPRRRRRSIRSSSISHPTNHTIPTIIITPSPPQPRSPCRTPYQDSAFRTRLVVPGYFVANDIHPPQLPHPHHGSRLPSPQSSACSSAGESWRYAHLGASTMVLKEWVWEHGHWRAVLPSLEEQEERGLFARSLVVRRRKGSIGRRRREGGPVH
ncbi:hypothetical protein BDV98DRAFT_589197 [Pterulicium gracile]|uniref:Uncharacterized protein n=1 Tax=Pterulicium gracile TaxID=1884261 RepID=A0A5C3QZ57_9AGAR|nr:hypothetical protein BDV98DRAFT_589197 [Pterula gracilis]